MADKSAKSHTHQSNRERPRKALERKTVYKSVLENPFRVRWPSIPINLQNIIFAHLTSLLNGAAAFHQAQTKVSRKRKRAAEDEGSKKKLKKGDVTMEDAMLVQNVPAIDDHNAEGLPPKPIVLNHITCGINAVTKRLEAQARQVRRNVIMTTEENLVAQVPIALVFVCRADVDPPILIDHIPPLIAACNSVQSNLKQPVKLVPLPKDSEGVLAAKLGIKRASVIALDAQYPGIEEFTTRLESVTPITAPWLMTEAKSTQLVPTHVKQLKTSAPKDMKAAKDARLEGRSTAKEKKKSTKSKITILSS